MDELFSCRNCIQNCGQSLLIGRGAGYCVKHDTVLFYPERTTCKYLHRKDLPRFVVDEGLREHASEFAGFSGIADLVEHKPVDLHVVDPSGGWGTPADLGSCICVGIPCLGPVWRSRSFAWGCYMMGCGDGEGNNNEKPVHEVCVPWPPPFFQIRL